MTIQSLKTHTTLLLHSCCAPCSTYPIHLLKGHYQFSLFFYNPNIQPENEYRIREKEMVQMAEKWIFNRRK